MGRWVTFVCEPGLSTSFDRSSTTWQIYCEVNNYYVTPLVEHCNEGDFVFVFDPVTIQPGPKPYTPHPTPHTPHPTPYTLGPVCRQG